MRFDGASNRVKFVYVVAGMLQFSKCISKGWSGASIWCTGRTGIYDSR